MERPNASLSDTRQFRLIIGRAAHDSSSMKDVGQASRKTRWQDAVRIQLSRIADLPMGWDGYGAGKLPSDTVLFAYQILAEFWLPTLPIPDISPMSSEAIMVEWITRNYELSLEIEAPYDVAFLFENLLTGDTQGGQIFQDLSILDPYLKLIITDGGSSSAAA